ncbi:Protocadherin-8 [Tupaia chinensis]|uniref:Protocadherin-8 n=1 Tax=Tupaia chinensis TaxID=246437 RepID=L9K798_TUPCH|nr:Protocadherin-8 [Tupaia chinensis]
MNPGRRWGSPCLFPLQLFGLCWVLSVAQSKTVRYSTFEEDAPGTVIGTLAEDLHMKVSGDTSFRLMKQFNSSLLRVREGDGQLTVGDAGLDRERLCGQAPQCVLAFDVVSFSQEQFRLVHVEVEVRDVNDHAPRFPRAQIPVEVSEGAAVGTRIPLEVPVDEDVGANGLQSVRLAEPHSPFRVELQTRADGAQCADLVLLQELDRESQATYSLELVAQDGGRPPRSATAALSVRVLDANDHSPAFPQGAVAEVELAEDAPVGSLLLDLDAADPDEGPNGDVVFAFGARTPPEARRLFRLDPRSGRLTLAGPPYGASPGFGKEPAPPVAVWKGHSFNTISGREAEKFSGKDSGKGDSDFNDSDSDISGDALKKDLINHMQSGLWACTAECKILGHSDRCWSPSCGGPNAHPSPHPPAQMSTFCKSTSLPRDPLRRDNYYQAQLPKTVGLQSVYEKVLHRDYDRTVTLLSPPRPARLPDLQEIGVPLYQSPPGRYLSPKKGANENV